jgi:hypothetical protein
MAEPNFEKDRKITLREESHCDLRADRGHICPETGKACVRCPHYEKKGDTSEKK